MKHVAKAEELENAEKTTIRAIVVKTRLIAIKSSYAREKRSRDIPNLMVAARIRG